MMLLPSFTTFFETTYATQVSNSVHTAGKISFYDEEVRKDSSQFLREIIKLPATGEELNKKLLLFGFCILLLIFITVLIRKVVRNRKSRGDKQ